MSNESDGGKWALVGFLYQFVGMLSITAHAYGPITISSRDEPNELEALLTLLGVGEGLRAHHERFEQDAVFTRDDECVLVQFKYSTVGRKIGKREIGEIIGKLDEAAHQAASQGLDVTACVLITNRQLTSRGGRAAKQFLEAEQDRGRDYELRYSRSSMENLVRVLQKFGRDYGLFDQEIETSIDRVIGRVFRETVEPLGASVSRDELVESFVSYHEARPLTVTCVAELAYEELDQFGEAIRIDQWDNAPIRRHILDDVIQAVNERALVGLYGNGGSGKSVVIWQLLRWMLEQASGCCMIASARGLPGSWITDTVHRWRNLPPGRRPDDNRERAIERLLVANSDLHRQILWLALDGLDEGVEFDQRSHIQELVEWFWSRDRECQRSGNPPSATLIVSCRRREDLEGCWLNLPYDYPGERPPNIRIGDFSTAEVEEAARRTFPELHQRLLSITEAPFLDSIHSSLPSRHAFPYPQSGFVDEQALQVLKHPVMWRALLRLEEPVRTDFIEGESQAAYRLASEFIQWFHWKLGFRSRELRNLSENTLIDILGAIARHSNTPAPNSRDENWIEPACRVHQYQINRREAIVLYKEANSAGLITLDARHLWRWRHLIVRDYLASI